jgi:hypothetical protein
VEGERGGGENIPLIIIRSREKIFNKNFKIDFPVIKFAG